MFFLRACHRHRPHYVVRISGALPALFASALCGFSTSPQGSPIIAFYVRLYQNFKWRMQSASLPNSFRRPVRDVLVLLLLYRSSLSESVSPLQGDTLLQVTLYVVNLLVGKIRCVAFFNLHLNDFGGGVDSLESLIVAVLDESVRELLFVVFQLSDAPL